VVIGGLITSTALTLLIVPALYRWTARRHYEPLPSWRGVSATRSTNQAANK